MSLRSDDTRWGGVAKAFHWLMAVLILGLGAVGLVMADLANSPQKLKIYALHKSVGLTVLALALLRLAWRLLDRRPRDLPMPRWQALAAFQGPGVGCLTDGSTEPATAGCSVLFIVCPLRRVGRG